MTVITVDAINRNSEWEKIKENKDNDNDNDSSYRPQ